MSTLRLAVFVTPHGFGHAARACAVMEAIRSLRPEVRFEVFTSVPGWFFSASLEHGFRLHPLFTDVGLVQRTTLHEDPAATAAVLERFVPFDSAAVCLLADLVVRAGCDGVLVDISPLGIEVGRAAGLPVVLVENFLWSWIYEAYVGEVPALRRPIEVLAASFARATHRVRCEPVCGPGDADLTVAPVSRRARAGRDATRRALGVAESRPLVLVTMGGTPWRPSSLAPLERRPDITFVIPGATDTHVRHANLELLPRHSRFFHPDLMAAADVVIGKVGYSTVAEAFRAGVPLGYVSRQRFPESPAIERFIGERMQGLAVTTEEAQTSGWVYLLDALLAMPRRARDEDGAGEVAAFVLAVLGAGTRPVRVSR
ncbi:MAG: hypothetical protein KA072_06965 [Thermoanaerobaculaceae bacterium]|nr:hypothetical protein [Thermoanaerobaculaceae bacterium]MDI9622502.1 hypothetical protein [Acidobacteriota bacterium]NLH12019.1 hypothetical protein [Holophagae bacterium]HPW56172.1 hypothetical protein [Thermoanaerobaculaceae bacterium]